MSTAAEQSQLPANPTDRVSAAWLKLIAWAVEALQEKHPHEVHSERLFGLLFRHYSTSSLPGIVALNWGGLDFAAEAPMVPLQYEEMLWQDAPTTDRLFSN